MLVLEIDGWFTLDNDDEIGELPENTKFAEVLEWLGIGVKEWNTFYAKYRETANVEISWAMVEHYATTSNVLEELLLQAEQLYATITPDNVQLVLHNILDEFEQYIPNDSLISGVRDLIEDRICLAMLTDLEDAMSLYFPDVPLVVTGDNWLYHE